MRIGIFGGTFDPVHHGHLIVAEEVREKLSLEKITFVPSGSPPHKGSGEVSDATHRYRMICLGAKLNPHFEVSRVELDRGGKSYSVETIQELSRVYGPGAILNFVVGSDAAGELFTWKRWEELLGLCHFVIVPRPGFPVQAVEERFRKGAEIVEVRALAISSREIRERVRKGRSITYLVPTEVEDYILANGLYQEG